MARLSDDRISHLARKVLEAAGRGDAVVDERRALLEAKRVLSECFQLEDRLDPTVRSRIPRRVAPGTAEPCASVTTPPITARSDLCARSGLANEKTTRRARKRRADTTGSLAISTSRRELKRPQ